MAGKDKTGKGEEPRKAALSVELRLLTPRNSPSWPRMTGRTGTRKSLLCAEHRDQTEENIVLFSFPRASPSHPGRWQACTRRGASWQPTASGRLLHSGQSGERGPSSPPSAVSNQHGLVKTKGNRSSLYRQWRKSDSPQRPLIKAILKAVTEEKNNFFLSTSTKDFRIFLHNAFLGELTKVRKRNF